LFSLDILKEELKKANPENNTGNPVKTSITASQGVRNARRNCARCLKSLASVPEAKNAGSPMFAFIFLNFNFCLGTKRTTLEITLQRQEVQDQTLSQVFKRLLPLWNKVLLCP